MNQRTIIGWGFRTGGVLIGVPSLALTLVLGFDLLADGGTPAVSDTGHLPVGKYGLISLLVDGARGAGAAMRGSIAVMHGVARLAAVMAAAIAVFGALLFVVGGGIVHRAAWARVAAVIFSLAFLAAWWGVSNISHGAPLFASYAGMAIALWTLWVLCLRYA